MKGAFLRSLHASATKIATSGTKLYWLMKEEEKGEAAPSCANHVLSRDSWVTLVVIAAEVQSLSLHLLTFLLLFLLFACLHWLCGHF